MQKMTKINNKQKTLQKFKKWQKLTSISNLSGNQATSAVIIALTTMLFSETKFKF